jgi:hypothetical protein
MKILQVLPGSLEAGTMMIQEGLPLPKLLEMETDAYSRRWRSVKALDSFSMGRKLDAVGLHLFFVAGHITTIAFGLGGERSVHKAVERIAAKVKALELNCLELTQIARKHFLGVPYIAISAHSYHIQQGWCLENADERRRSQPEAIQ